MDSGCSDICLKTDTFVKPDIRLLAYNSEEIVTSGCDQHLNEEICYAFIEEFATVIVICMLTRGTRYLIDNAVLKGTETLLYKGVSGAPV